jgi:RecA-family ATPase
VTAAPDHVPADPQEWNRRLKEEDEARRAAHLEVIKGGITPETWAPVPSIFIRRPDSKARWGERKVSHKRAMQCFDRCVAIQAQQERNSLTRRARLLKAAKDLGLAAYINRAKISQRVLEAKDEQLGHAFCPLTAADRLAMERPILRWLVPGLIPAEDMTIIGGRPKVGKTRLTIALVAAVLKGEPAMGFEAPACRDVILITDEQSDGG